MNKKFYWLVLFNPIILGIFFLGMRTLYLLCQYGSVHKRLPIIVLTGIIELLWFLIWTLIYIVFSKRNKQNIFKHEKIKVIFLCVELLCFFIVAGFFGYKIYYSAIDYHGKLAWYIEEKNSSIKVKLTDNNFFTDGTDGILNDLNEKRVLPEILYVKNTFCVKFNSKGTITYIYAFLYGKDKDGNLKSYLISYNAKDGKNMTVVLDGEVNATYYEQTKLKPMHDMITTFIKSEYSKEYFNSQKAKNITYSFRYKGFVSQEKAVDGYLVYLEDSPTNEICKMDKGDINGYMVNVLIDSRDSTFIVTGSGRTAASMSKETQDGSAESKKSQNGDTVVDDKGNMHFQLDKNSIMTLSIEDAAAGSRFYSFTGPEGNNSDPFGGNCGVAAGMLFLNKDTGFAVLSSGSYSFSKLYYTKDGGLTFSLQKLPVEDGAKDILGNKNGYTVKDYDYIDVPYEENGKMYVKVSTELNSIHEEYMLFCSGDQGESWTYQSYVSN